MTFILGALLLLAAIGAIILMIAASIYMVLKENEDERVERLAEKRFREMLKSAKIRVYYRVNIVDEMKK